MRKHFIKFLVVILVVASSCGSLKKNVPSKEYTELPKSEKELSENQRIEFEFLYIEGLKQKSIGTPETAIRYFNKCLEINPNSAAALYELGSLFASKREFTGAKLYLQKAIQINPNNKWYKLLLAQIYQNTNQFAEASKIYTDLIKTDPNNIDYYYFNALLLASAQQYDQAIKAYYQLEQKVGYNEQIALARQNIYRSAGKNKEAYNEIDKLIKLNPNIPEYYGVMADMYKEDGNMAKALEYYNKVLDVDPNNGFVHFSLANYYAENKKFDKVIEHAQKGFSNPEVEIDTKIQLYLMLINSPEEQTISTPDIENLVKSVVNAHPSDARSYSIMADFLIKNEKPSEARLYLIKAVEINPNSYPVWEQIILISSQLSDFENMLADSKKAIELFPTQPLLYVLNAVALIQTKNYEQALTTLETGINYLGDNKRLEAQFELYKAEAYYNLKQRQKAFTAFEKVIEIDQTNYMAMNNYAYYLSLRSENLDKAELLSSRVIQANPDNPTYLDTHAWVLFKKKEYRLAKFYMEAAIKNGGSENHVIIEHYGDILFMLNDLDGALKNWQKAIENGSDSEILKRKIAEKQYIDEVEEQ